MSRQLGGLPVIVDPSVRPDRVRVVVTADYTGPGSGLDGSDPTAPTVNPAVTTPTDSAAPPPSPILIAGSDSRECVD